MRKGYRYSASVSVANYHAMKASADFGIWQTALGKVDELGGAIGNKLSGWGDKAVQAGGNRLGIMSNAGDAATAKVGRDTFANTSKSMLDRMKFRGGQALQTLGANKTALGAGAVGLGALGAGGAGYLGYNALRGNQ